MTVKRVFAPGAFYHIYNRGASKQKIFLDDSDKNRFTNLLYLCNGDKRFKYKDLKEGEIFNFTFDKGVQLVEICAWVMMDNHFHLLIFVPESFSIENISKFLHKLSLSYLMYFNKKYNKSGTLFEGRFKSNIIDDDLYLKYLYSYIHLNPLKMLNSNWKEEGLKIKNAESYLQDYKYSSIGDLVWKRQRNEAKILSSNGKIKEISDLVNTLENLYSLIPDPGRGRTGK